MNHMIIELFDPPLTQLLILLWLWVQTTYNATIQQSKIKSINFMSMTVKMIDMTREPNMVQTLFFLNLLTIAYTRQSSNIRLN